MGMEVGVATETVAGQGGRKRRRGGHKTSGDTERGDVRRGRAAWPVRVFFVLLLLRAIPVQ